MGIRLAGAYSLYAAAVLASILFLVKAVDETRGVERGRCGGRWPFLERQFKEHSFAGTSLAALRALPFGVPFEHGR